MKPQHLQQLIEDQAIVHYKTEPILQTTFIKGANYALNLDRWVKIEQLPDYTDDVLFLFEDGDIQKGFRNVYGELMLGNQGRFASRYTGVDNPITHWQPLPAPPEK